MFSSNQVLEVSGNLSHIDELETVLDFALKYSGYAEYMKKEKIDRGCKLLYQITKDGKYCIGWGNENVPKGWNEYPFRFEIDIVSRIIRQHLESFSISKEANSFSTVTYSSFNNCKKSKSPAKSSLFKASLKEATDEDTI